MDMDLRKYTQLLSGVGVLLFSALLVATVMTHELQPEIKDFQQAAVTWLIMTIACCVINYMTRKN